MSDENSNKLLEILKPYFDVYDEIRVVKENDKLMIYGVNYEEVADYQGVAE